MTDSWATLVETLNADIQIYFKETLLYDGPIRTTIFSEDCCTITGTNTIFDGYGLTIIHNIDNTDSLKFGNKQ